MGGMIGMEACSQQQTSPEFSIWGVLDRDQLGFSRFPDVTLPPSRPLLPLPGCMRQEIALSWSGKSRLQQLHTLAESRVQGLPLPRLMPNLQFAATYSPFSFGHQATKPGAPEPRERVACPIKTREACSLLRYGRSYFQWEPIFLKIASTQLSDPSSDATGHGLILGWLTSATTPAYWRDRYGACSSWCRNPLRQHDNAHNTYLLGGGPTSTPSPTNRVSNHVCF